MAIGEHDATGFVDNESGGVAGSGGLSVEGAGDSDAQDNDGRDDAGERPPPVLRRGRALAERNGVVDVHIEAGLAAQRLRSVLH